MIALRFVTWFTLCLYLCACFVLACLFGFVIFVVGYLVVGLLGYLRWFYSYLFDFMNIVALC